MKRANRATSTHLWNGLKLSVVCDAPLPTACHNCHLLRLAESVTQVAVYCELVLDKRAAMPQYQILITLE